MIVDICFIILATSCTLCIIWLIIPDCYKSYWDYLRQVRRDKKKGKKGKYSFTWKR